MKKSQFVLLYKLTLSLSGENEIRTRGRITPTAV